MIEASYDTCRKISRRSRSNFCVSFLLLPREKRRAMEALYAFMRHTDDIADNPGPAKDRREALLRWRTTFDHALAGRFDEISPDDRPAAELLPAVVDMLRRFQVPAEHLYAVIDGVEMDLDRQRYETFDELEQYCRLVASAVGAACIHIWGFRDRMAIELAEKCGIAMQLTNILRDIGEDARQGRIYLPLEDLRRCDYSVEELLDGLADRRFRNLVAMEVDRAQQYYSEGAKLRDLLDRDGRRVFGIMTATYRTLLRKIARRPADVFTRRIRLNNWDKLRIGFKLLV